MTVNNLIWIDVETTGIEVDTHSLLEVACLITDLDLNILDEAGFQSPVFFTEEESKELFKSTSPFVQDMHIQTDLWTRLTTEGVELDTLDSQLHDYMKTLNPEPQTAWLAGNSIFLDRSYINKYLPKSAEHIHYRDVNATSWAGPMEWWFGESFEKKKTHQAMDDIRESIAELKSYKDAITAWRNR